MDLITVNVGQGSLAIVRHASEAVVIDARMPPSGDATVSSVKGHLARFLKGHNLRGVILTGLDADHSDVRCLAILLRKYRPDWVLLPDCSKDTTCSVDVLELLKSEEAARAATPSPLQVMAVTTASVTAAALAKLSSVFGFELFSPHADDMTSSNNSSLVVRITGIGTGGFSYLVTGDTENDRWATINRMFGKRLASHVLAAPHHGARDATNAETLHLVSPNTILISAGVDNQYGHPDSSVVQAYLSIAAHVSGTHVDGGCSLRTAPKNGDFRTIAFVD